MKTTSHVRLHLQWLAAGTGLAASAGPWEPNVTFAGFHGALAPERVPAVLLQEGCRVRLGKRWLKWTVGGAAGVLAAGAGILLYAAVRWNSTTDEIRERLRADARPIRAAVYSADDLADLPAPVARYFRRVMPDGQPLITHARIRWAGEFNMGTPDRDRWVSFTAVQDFYPGAPGMVWDARMSMGPGFVVRVRDAFVDGTGSMYGAVMGLVPVVDVQGTSSIATAALQRYLAEAAWFPTALLPVQGVSWTMVSDTVARATLRVDSISASVDFRFGDEGLVESVFVPDRLYDDGRSEPGPQPWQGRNLSYETQHGFLVPADAVVEWLLPQRTYAYWRARPTSIEYEYGTWP